MRTSAASLVSVFILFSWGRLHDAADGYHRLQDRDAQRHLREPHSADAGDALPGKRASWLGLLRVSSACRGCFDDAAVAGEYLSQP